MKTLNFLLLSLLIALYFPVQAELMRGMYSYMADAGLFLDCQREQRFPVATKADNAALERTYLKHRYLPGKSLLMEVEGQQQGGSRERELHFIIKADSNTLKGFGGCNYFSGPVTADGSNISLVPFRSTRKACPNLKIEQSFMDIIGKAEQYKVKDESLELFSQGHSIAKFTAI